MSEGGATAQTKPAEAPVAVDTATRGWFVQPRAWRESEVYRALRTAEARHVAEIVLFDRPRWEDEQHMFGTMTFIVRRGELFDSEESLAERAGTTRKVVRTVLQKLEKAGLIRRRKVHPAGQCPHVITVLHYEASQRIPRRDGPANGTANGTTDGPADGPAKGPQGNQETAIEPQAPQAPPANLAAGGLESFREKLASRLGRAAVDIGRHPDTKRREDVITFFEAQLAAVGEESLLIECCALAEKSTTGVPGTLGWFVNWLANLPAPQPTQRGNGLREFVGLDADGKAMYRDDQPRRYRVTEPASPHTAFRGGEVPLPPLDNANVNST